MLNLENAIVYDIETFPNCFTLTAENLFNGTRWVFEISEYKDDRRAMVQFFNWLNQTQTPMVGFNNIHFDFPVIDLFFRNPNATFEQLYQKAMAIINSFADRFGHVVWQNDRFAPQIDVFKIHHFDNRAKSTSLKALQVNMRSPTVVDMPVEVGTNLTREQIDKYLIPYNIHDVQETKQFTHFSMDAIKYRLSLVEQFGVDVMNWPDTKIGSRMMEERIGRELCFDYSSGRKQTRQSPRARLDVKDLIFPYVRFENPEFQRILDYLNTQQLTADELNQFSDEPPKLKTKGVFTGLKATVGGIDFHFGTGGIHGSVTGQRIESTDEWVIEDIDVASLYPSIAIVNRLAPEHLGQRFTEVYSEIPQERKKWQIEKGKKCVEANTLKLAANGVYGNSNNAYSPFYDPKYTLTITINGQLLLCMLAEKLVNVPTLKIIQINTDGITYYIRRDYRPAAAAICREWEQLTALVLEDVEYSRMFIRDVNSYIAEDTSGDLKLKGAYWTPDALDYHGSISAAQPAAWHKDLSNLVSTRAAVAAMVHGVDPETFIRFTSNPYDFMIRAKVNRADNLLFGGQPVQKTSRYFVSKQGERLLKQSPPAGPLGAFKRAPRVSESEYQRVMSETGGQWDERVCTKNKSTYQNRETAIQAGHVVSMCNDVADFDFNNVNFEWYVNEARKLIIVCHKNPNRLIIKI